LTAGQANYVLERLIGDRRVSPAEVTRYVGEMRQEIDELERRLESLRSAVGGASAAGRRPGRPPQAQGEAAPRRRRRRAITPEQAASRVLQGRYLGLIRQIPAGKRTHYARLAKEKGREAAIKEMSTALKR
jgi:hypothetical protein